MGLLPTIGGARPINIARGWGLVEENLKLVRSMVKVTREESGHFYIDPAAVEEPPILAPNVPGQVPP